MYATDHNNLTVRFYNFIYIASSEKSKYLIFTGFKIVVHRTKFKNPEFPCNTLTYINIH